MNNRYCHKPFLTAVVLSAFFIFFSTQSDAQTIQEWYDDAQERIDTLRKGPFGLEIFDKDGVPFSGNVKVRMVKHEYPFGVAFDFYRGEEQTEIPTETQWMQAAMYKYFNYGAVGNSFKWSGIQPQNTEPNYTNFEYALNWAQKVGWELRAHTLLWGGAEGDNHAMPQWVTGLGTAELVFEKCEERVRREVSRYKGVIKEYDVINEPLHATYTQELYGDSLNWKCFEWARDEDPDAELYINEYNVEYGWGDADEYKALIEDIIDRGSPVTGIGMQAHFWDCCRPNITEFVTQINKLAEIGLPIRLTEFDFGGNLSEAQQADDFIKVMTIAFSHPSITGIIYWNLSDNTTWRDNAGLFHSDHRPKLAADTLLYLTKKLWATNFEEAVAAEPLSFDAYYGDYLVDVQFGDTIKQFTVPLHTAFSDSVFQLYENKAVIKGPELVTARLSQLDELELAFDAAIDPATIDKYDFRVFANQVSIQDIAVKEGADSVLVFSLSKDISFASYPTVSYFPGSLTAKNGGLARAFGTEAIIVPAELNQPPLVDDQEFEVSNDVPGGSVLGTVAATDPEGRDLTFKIAAGNNAGIFGIDAATGELVVVSPALLERESSPYELTVEVSDGFHTSSATMTVHLAKILGLHRDTNSQIDVYPNPSGNVLTISSEAGFQQVELYDQRGRMVFLKKYPRSVATDELSPGLKTGIYILKVYVENDVETKKVAVVK